MELFPRKSRRHQGLDRNHYDCILLSIALLLLSKFVTCINVCEYHKCRPDCTCDVRFDDVCAKEYGNYGWDVPEDHGQYLYHYMRPDFELGNFEIKPAGMRGRDERVLGQGEGIGEITKAAFWSEIAGNVFFEVHPDRLKQNQIKVELYGKTEFGLEDCSGGGAPLATFKMGQQAPEGVLKTRFSTSVSEFSSYNDKFRDYSFECHPRATNAVMAAVNFSITKPNFDIVQKNVFVPAKEGEKEEGYDGDFLFCIRVNTIKQGKTANFIDTKIKLSGSKTTNNFIKKDNIRMFSTKPIDSKHAHVLKQGVEVGAFPCKIPDGTETAPEFPAYSIGQDLSICVGPTEDFAETFEVTGFKTVTCTNSGQTRRMVANEENDMLTTVESSPMGFADLGTGITLQDSGIMAVSTKITTGLVQRGDLSMLCSGEVYVQSKGRRSLQQQQQQQQQPQKETQTLEREERPTTAAFEVTIGLKEVDLAAFSSSGSESLYHPSQRLWTFGFFLLPAVLALSGVLF